MFKVFLPLGLIAGSIAAMSVSLPNIVSRPSISLAQAQLAPAQSDGPIGNMTQESLENILREIAKDVEVNQNQVFFTFKGRSLLLVTDEGANRMRIISPIIKVNDVSGEEMAKMMIANFHTALDGRYAISNGVVYAAFIHPLSSLNADDFRSGVAQVTRLTQTFGSTYSSGGGLFGAPAAPTTETTDTLPAI